MRRLLERLNRFLGNPLQASPRLLVFAAALVLVATYVWPLWNMTMFAPQYPDGLRLHIYSWRLDGGNEGRDLREINILNHYIGMRDLDATDFTEFKWIPFVVGAMGLLFLRTVVHGRMSYLVDVVVIFLYFSSFSLWSFAYKMWLYGHSLAATAPVKVPPFMPPLFGYKQLANFEVYSYPGLGSYAFGAALLLLVTAFVAAWRQDRRADKGAPA